MRRFEIAMGLIKQGDKYHFQLRNGDNQAGALGLIGCFGGKIEPKESAQAAVCREIGEESTLKPAINDLTLAGEVKVNSERNGDSIKVRARIFSLTLASNVKIDAREGELVTMTAEEVYANLAKFTPATRAYFEQIHQEV